MFFEPAPTALDLNFRLFGVPVRVHPMHWVVSLLLGPPMKAGAALVAAWVICVFLSILLHEMGHIMMGRLFGSDGHIVLYSFGGLAIPDRGLSNRFQRILVSFAGPLVQLILAAALIVVGLVAQFRGYQAAPNVQCVYSFLLEINLFWAVLNLLPIWPLDGGRISREVCTWFSPLSGVRASLILSFCAAGFLATVCITAYLERPIIPHTEPLGDLYLTLFFAFFAIGSIMAFNEMSRPRSWQDDQWPHERQEEEYDTWKR